MAELLSKIHGVHSYFLMSRGSDTAPVVGAGWKIQHISGDGLGMDEIIARLNSDRGPLLIDSYDAETSDLEKLRYNNFRVAMFDDGRRLDFYPCDLVIDSAPGALELPYHGLPETCFRLGSKYLPLRAEFLQRLRIKKIRETIETIVVTFGGSDPNDVTGRVLKVLGDLDRDVGVAAILGPAYNGTAEEIASRDHRIRIHRNIDNISSVMASVDVAVSSSGGTASELAFIGVPMLLLSLSENQIPIAKAMAASEVALDFGFYDRPWENDVFQALTRLFEDRDGRKKMSLMGQASIDGNGAHRVAEAIWTTLFPADNDRPG